jgi:NAD(P)-dependent dehydrogenase (short-subunit alcohol dehydrogenase family)
MTAGGARPIRFDGRVAIVTGAGRGLGAAYAELLAGRGAAVVVHDAGVDLEGGGADSAVAQAVVRRIAQRGGTAVACDENLESPAACRRVIELALARFQRLDVLVHNAGLVVFSPIDTITQDTWDRMVSVGVHAPFHLVQAALPHMRRQRYGRIVVTTSGRALRIADAAPGLAAYMMGKMAQLGLMVGVAVETEAEGIRINAVAPVAATRVLRRHAPELRPEHVAPAVAFLVSEQCDVSGVVLRAAGGRFSTTSWIDGPEVDLGAEPVEPEVFAQRWTEIAPRR